MNFMSELGSEGSSLEDCWRSLATPALCDIQYRADKYMPIPRVHCLGASCVVSPASEDPNPAGCGILSLWVMPNSSGSLGLHELVEVMLCSLHGLRFCLGPVEPWLQSADRLKVGESGPFAVGYEVSRAGLGVRVGTLT